MMEIDDRTYRQLDRIAKARLPYVVALAVFYTVKSFFERLRRRKTAQTI
ncbi:MAG: hypothetical protein NTW66_00425 [Candidatus Magasanikbacteria bacterium]|nr:hypothetical protein [Candidatus Magasanikbacteria bacterium]